MPIAVRVVTAEEFQAFITALQESRDYASAVAVLPAIQ
jgi:cytochrome c oxidase subunit 2